MAKMKTLKHASYAAVLAGGLLAPMSAHAITVDGIDFETGSTLKVATIFENRVFAPGDVLDGIGRVDSVQAPPGAITWQNGNNGRELTFRFQNYVVEAVTPTVAGINVVFSGGTAQLYSDTNQDFTVTGPGVTQASAVASATNGNLWLDLVAAGADTCGSLGLTCASGAGTIVTLNSNITAGTLAAIGNGDGNGFLNVVGGSAGSFFDTNNQPPGVGPFDFLLASDFADNNDPNNPFPLSGSADLRGQAATPPPPPTASEPAAIGLLGIGLIGLGLARRRRRASA